MATGRSIIEQALSKLNATAANAVATADDLAVSLPVLNALIDSKSTEFLNIHRVTPVRFEFIAGQYNYELGPTGDWVTERPMRLEKAKLMINPIIVRS